MKQNSEPLDVVKLLPAGARNAVSAAELARLTGTNTRSISRAIARHRRTGLIICSNSTEAKTGYYLPENVQEIKDFVYTELKRRASHMAAIRPAVDWLRKNGGQP